MIRRPRVSRLEWPLELRPGDERFVVRALLLCTSDKRTRVKYLFGPAIDVIGPYRIAENTFEFPAHLCDHTVPLKFTARRDAPVNARVDLAIVLSCLRYVPWRVGLAVALILVALAPPVSHAFQWGMGRLSLSVGDAAIVTIPLGLAIAAAATWGRILAVVRNLLCEEVFREDVIATFGDEVVHIQLVENVAKYGYGTWSVDR